MENENADEDEYNEEGAGQGEEGEEEEPLEVDEEVPVETGPPSEVVAVSAPAANGETGVGQSGNKENPGKEVKTAKDKPQEERTGDNQESGTNKAPKTKEENDANTDRKTRDENTAKQNPAQAGKEPSEGEKPLEGKETNDKAGTYLWGCYFGLCYDDARLCSEQSFITRFPKHYILSLSQPGCVFVFQKIVQRSVGEESEET